MVVPVLATRTDRTRFRDQHRRILVGTPQPPRVTDLVRQAQQGDQTAFQSLYLEHVGRVYALCLRLTADTGEAEELTQDAFVRAWERLATFRGESAFSSWLYRLTVNVVFMSRRAARRRAQRVFATDRKSTRLNSSHGYISYAVFCLKKKKKKRYRELM